MHFNALVSFSGVLLWCSCAVDEEVKSAIGECIERVIVNEFGHKSGSHGYYTLRDVALELVYVVVRPIWALDGAQVDLQALRTEFVKRYKSSRIAIERGASIELSMPRVVNQQDQHANTEILPTPDSESASETEQKSGRRRRRRRKEPKPTKAPLTSEPIELATKILIKSFQPKKLTAAGSDLWTSMNLPRLSGGVIDAAQLETPLKRLETKLLDKNVATDIVQTVLANMRRDLIGQKPGYLSSLSSALEKSFKAQVSTLMLSVSTKTFLDNVRRSKTHVLVLCGVNGVGKSTTLSKLAYLLAANNISVLIAACDTFRSGAIEQLKTHVSKLNGLGLAARVELYEAGYGRDPAVTALDAVRYGQKNAIGCVLVDTAGRMQDNQLLMDNLNKLVTVTKPHDVVFVGEALVGHASLDQLNKFNVALKKNNNAGLTKLILTKFDTIDEKVGAVLNMSVVSKAPVLFLGTGQTYVDIMELDIESVSNILL